MSFGSVNVPGKLTAADVGASASGHTHTAAQVGAAAANHTHTAAQVGADASGSAAAVQGKLNSHTGNKSNPHSVTAAQAGAVPTGRKVNGKPLSADITLSAADVGASASGHTHTATQVGAVPTSRKVNNKALSADITLSAADVGAATTGHAHTAAQVGALPITGGTLTGDLRIKGSGNFGTKINLGDGDYVYIAEPTDDNLEIKGKTIKLVTSKNASGIDVDTGLIGKSMAGQSVSPVKDQTVTAGEGAEIFNDYRTRTYVSSGDAMQGNVASGRYSHAEGCKSVASGEYSHTEGLGTTASGMYSHAEGCGATASGECSHAEGIITKAIGSHSSHAEGYLSTASGDFGSHAEGASTVASGGSSHTEGNYTKASGDSSHAEGYSSNASGDRSHAGGSYTIAEYWAEMAIGKYNVQKSPSANNIASDLFVVGKGNENARANAFRVSTSGVYGTSAFNATGADYAEMFEWLDGNPDGEDRVGRFVTLDGEKIRIAGTGDNYILGVVSGCPSVVGNVHDDQWQGMFLHDIFDRPVWEDAEVPEETVEEADPEDPERTITRVTTPARIERRQKLNPDYDHSQKYVPRSERPEWSAVGMLGVLSVRDDGTCQVNGFCRVAEGGTATAAEAELSIEGGQIRKGYRVLERVSENVVRIVFR